MFIYFLLIRIVALFGHRKAKKLCAGQCEVRRYLKEHKDTQTDLQGCVWFHASSVGEFEQARPIIEKLKKEKPDLKILLTFFSPSGYELRKDYKYADKVMYLPFATKRNARHFLHVFNPAMAIFIKYEFWPAYLRELNRRNIPTYLISGIFRPKQTFFKPWGSGYRHLLTRFTKMFVQDKASLALLNKFHITNVEVAGDTRFDRVYWIAQHANEIPTVEHFVTTQLNEFERPIEKVIIAGSTWPQDELLLARYIEEHPDVRLVLVPHEIDEKHLHTIFQIFQGRYVRFTEATPHNVLHVQTLVIDTIGMLSSIYRYGKVAYIGGGFGVGIHNTLEPAVYGMPVVFGPNYQRFREAKGLIAAGAGFSINNYEEFERIMDMALEQYAELGAKAKEYVASELGATTKITDEIFDL